MRANVVLVAAPGFDDRLGLGEREERLTLCSEHDRLITTRGVSHTPPARDGPVRLPFIAAISFITSISRSRSATGLSRAPRPPASERRPRTVN